MNVVTPVNTAGSQPHALPRARIGLIIPSVNTFS